MILIYFKTPALNPTELSDIKRSLNLKLNTTNEITHVESEYCFYVEVQRALTELEEGKLRGILKSFDGCVSDTTNFPEVESSCEFQVEIGPMWYFSSVFSSSDVATRLSAVLPVTGLNRSVRYAITFAKEYSCHMKNLVISFLCDGTNDCVYVNPDTGFNVSFKSEPWGRTDVVDDRRKDNPLEISQWTRTPAYSF